MKINQLKMGVFFSYASQAVSILSGLLYTPIMLRLLGQSEYGLYQMVYAVISYLGLLSLGFSSGYIRFYSQYKIKGDEKGVARLNGMYLMVFMFISVICLICGITMMFNIKTVFGEGLTASELETAKILLFLMVISLAINLVRSVFLSNISANERFLFHRGISFVHLLLEPFVTLPVLLMGYGSVGMVTVSTAFTVILFVCSVVYCFKVLKMKFSFERFEAKLFKSIFVFTFFIFINIIVDRINWSVDKFLLGRLVGTVAVAVYGVSSQINLLYINFSTAISCMFIPRINRFVSEEKDNSKLSELFIKVGRLQFLILALIVSGFGLFGREFINVWAGPEYRGAYYVGLFLMIPGTIPLIQNLGVEIQKAKNMHKVCAVINLAIAIGNIFLSIPLIQKYSYIGAAAGTAISLVLGNVFINWYYYKKMEIDIPKFWKEIFGLFPALFVSVGVAFVIIKILPPDRSLLNLVVNILIYTVVYFFAFWFVGMNEYERDLIKGPLGKVFSKIKRGNK
ncbi:MAG: oligosaccharide flippase family protein [Clostridia bacterium]|nr:oligosaccharide flippase family protein [Clostridia bacterium]